VSTERLVHHELCFGCGRTNLFGLVMDVAPTGERQVHGRGFVKQDHQGPVPGMAHEGVMTAALSEAMSFAAGPGKQASGIEVDLQAQAPVGAFLDVEAQARETPDGATEAHATASLDGRAVATARGTYRRR